MTSQDFMREAIRLSIDNIKQGGGPFGAVIVKDGEIIARGANHVVSSNDPTAHAEVTAIREACARLHTYDLSGCEIYSSCEPCPMCLSAIYWAHLSHLYFACTKDDAARIHFDDKFIYQELELPIHERHLPINTLMRDQALQAFRDWEDKPDKTAY
ncbi:MAG: nucleoside deaminase [Prevotellaceae bacterium]|nr:nucleoside deaminase [Prevotellaceae bacterium]MDY3856497.1 nucleoside deaminase [Bacteroidaceae bacterium]